VRDYLANDYFAVSPFDVGLANSAYLRLHPVPRASHAAGSRSQRLTHEVERAGALLNLELSDGPYGPWEPVIMIRLERVANIDGETLRFSPFRQGRDLRPRGFVHALRVGVYAVSQRARPTRTRA
jgi:hypothetical protein